MNIEDEPFFPFVEGQAIRIRSDIDYALIRKTTAAHFYMVNHKSLLLVVASQGKRFVVTFLNPDTEEKEENMFFLSSWHWDRFEVATEL